MKKIYFILVLLFCAKLTNSNDKFVIGAHGPHGFFILFLGVLNNIAWAERFKKTPIVFWSDKCVYFSKTGYNGSFNAWEYYFEPVSHLRYQSKDKIYAALAAPDGFAIRPYANGSYNENFHKIIRPFANKIINKYIKIKPNIKNKIDNFYNKHMAGRINIGIHLRGTDKKSEVKPVDPDLIFNKAKELASKLPDNNYQFLIATDEVRLLNLAKIALKNNIIFYDSYRSENGSAIHKVENKNMAAFGEEVLIEALLLSKCNYFIHTRSNVATGVLLFNPQLKNIFLGN